MTITTERILLNKERNVSLVTMVQAVGGEFGFEQRPAVVVIPGGGYSMCSDREAEVVAYPYLAAGFHAFVLRYSVGEHRTWPNPLDDYEQAMEYIHEHAEKWGLLTDKIAVIGFSAGGHLAGSTATLAKHRPGAAILVYAALEQDIASMCQPGTDIPSPTACVDEKTPPCFLVAAHDDPIVPMRNALNFMAALDRFGTTYECRIYPFGGHGFSAGESMLGGRLCARVRDWVRDSIGFLDDIFGRLTPNGLTAPVCAGKVNGDMEETLSVQCTLRHLRAYVAEVPALQPVMAAVDAIIEERFGGSEAGKSTVGQFKLAEILPMLGKTSEDQDEMDALLNAVPNVRRQ